MRAKPEPVLRFYNFNLNNYNLYFISYIPHNKLTRMSKTKTVTRSAMDDPELQELFNQMVGASDPDPKIVAPKYESILEDAKIILKIFKVTWIDTPYVSKDILTDFNKSFDDLRLLIQDGEKQLQELTLAKNDGILSGDSVKDINKNPNSLQAKLAGLDHGYDLKKLGEAYKALKESAIIDKIIVAVRDLRKCVEESRVRNKRQIHDIEDKEKLRDEFIAKCDGDFLQIMPTMFALDFKQLWLHPSCVYDLKKRVVHSLHLILKRGNNIVHNIMSPDIDVERFSEILISNIDKVRKHIPRCDKAFNKIKQSVQLLKNNFNGYYKDFVVSKNPGIIIENFVMDVADGSKADTETTYQFRKIINFYKEKMRGRVNDPKIQKIFDLVGQNLDVLEKKTGTSYGSKTRNNKSDDTSDDE